MCEGDSAYEGCRIVGALPLYRSVEGNNRTRIVTDKRASSEISGLIRDSDAYMSLHRSEGFGLTIARQSSIIAYLEASPRSIEFGSGVTTKLARTIKRICLSNVIRSISERCFQGRDTISARY